MWAALSSLVVYSCAINVHCLLSLSTPRSSVVGSPSACLSASSLQRRHRSPKRRQRCRSRLPRTVSECTSTHLRSRFSQDDDDVYTVSSRDVESENQRSDSFIAPTGGTSTGRQQKQRWVLLVDDESDIRQAVGQLLVESGFRVTTCQNGLEAWQLMGGPESDGVFPLPGQPTHWPPPALPTRQSNTTTDTPTESTQLVTVRDPNQPLYSAVAPSTNGLVLPDVIVSDVHMPIMDGLTLLSTIRSSEHVAHVPVVLLTVRAGPADRVAGYRAGADAYLPKPFDPDELVTLLHNVVARHEQMYTPLDLDRSRTGSSGTSSSGSRSTALLGELKRDVQDIQDWIVQRGGGGPGQPGWVAATDVFLAPDERQILQFLSDGLQTKDIAERTFLSTRRVEQLLTSMFRKTKVKNRTELVRWAIATGTVKL